MITIRPGAGDVRGMVGQFQTDVLRAPKATPACMASISRRAPPPTAPGRPA